MDTLLKLDNVSGGYGRLKVIDDVSLKIERGEFLGVIGPNGSGKSTLLRLMSKALPCQSGKIILGNRDVASMPSREFCRSAAFVSQDTLINFSFSVEEVVLMGRIPHLGRLAYEGKRDYAIAHNALSLTDALHLKDKAIDELSAGERQRVIIAKALTQEPVLLFLDEPTSHLDIGHQVQILDLLKRLNRKNNLTLIMVIHDLNLASQYCSRIVLLNEGRIFTQGSPEKVLTYQTIETVYKTVVVVNKNPLSSKPFVLLVSEEERCRQGYS